MGRQRSSRTSGATAVMDLVALLPWWVGVALAFVAYFWLHSVAGRGVTMRSMPPASSHLALIPVPAPPPMIGRPSAIFRCRRSRIC